MKWRNSPAQYRIEEVVEVETEDAVPLAVDHGDPEVPPSKQKTP
jgi:hypothetical protein